MKLVVLIFLIPISLWSQSDASKVVQPEKTTSTPMPAQSEKSSDPVQQNPDSKALKATYSPRAVYPLAAAIEKLQGQVWVNLLISETGDVEKVELLSGNPILAQAAVDAYRRWKFQPYLKRGRPVKVSVKLSMDFAFKEQIKDAVGSSSQEAGGRPYVNAGIAQGLLLHRVSPIYPDDARRLRIEGTVILRALIGKDGHIESLVPVSGPKALVPAAIGAVEQWRYRPYVMNGEPAEVDTEITVNFTLR